VEVPPYAVTAVVSGPVIDPFTRADMYQVDTRDFGRNWIFAMQLRGTCPGFGA
jgi:hypothetical protein